MKSCPTERRGREVERDSRKFNSSLGGPSDHRNHRSARHFGRQTQEANAPMQAYNLLGIAKRMFSWAVDQRCYRLSLSPCRDLKAAGNHRKKETRKQNIIR